MEHLQILNKLFSPTTFTIFFVFVKTFCVYMVAKYVVMAFFKRIVDNTKSRKDDSVYNFISKLIYLLIWIAGLCTVLEMFDVSLTGVWGAFTGTSIVMAYVVKDSLANFVSGFMMSTFGGAFKVGDIIEYGGNKVEVIDIGYLHTKFKLEDAILVVRNQGLVKQDIKNYTLAKEE